jgi:uncharacterized membrane protein
MKKWNNLFIYIAWFLFIVFWIFSIYFYTIFPDSIPVHFNLKGEVDRYGNKSTNFLLLAINTFVFVLLTLVKKIPEKFQKNISIIKLEREKQIFLQQFFINYLRVAIQIIFILGMIEVYQIVIICENMIGKFFLPYIIIFILFPTIFYAYKAIKRN